MPPTPLRTSHIRNTGVIYLGEVAGCRRTVLIMVLRRGKSVLAAVKCECGDVYVYGMDLWYVHTYTIDCVMLLADPGVFFQSENFNLS